MKYADIEEEKEEREQPSLFKTEAPTEPADLKYLLEEDPQGKPPLEGAEAKGEPPTLPSPVKFNIPAAKERFKEYREKVDQMWDEAKAMIVDNDATNITATELGTTAMTLFKKIRERILDVPNYVEAKEYVESVDALVSMLCERLYTTKKGVETIVSITKEKISAFAVVLEANRRKQEALERQAREDLQKKLDEQAKETGTKPVQVPGPLVTSKKEAPVRTEQGTSYQVPKWTFEVVNRELPRDLITKMLSLVTLEMGSLYEVTKQLDAIMPYTVTMWEHTRIQEAIKRGIREIAGLKIKEITETRFRTGKK